MSHPERLRMLRVRLGKYLSQLEEHGVEKYNSSQAGEATHRLEKMQVILEWLAEIDRPPRWKSRIEELSLQGKSEDEIVREMESVKPTEAEAREEHTLSIRAWTLVESLYYNGARALKILAKVPGLSRLRADGVRNVRNKLIEHPNERDSQVYELSFLSGGPAGYILKGFRSEERKDVFPDTGHLRNLEEFIANLEATLDRACKRLHGGPRDPALASAHS